MKKTCFTTLFLCLGSTLHADIQAPMCMQEQRHSAGSLERGARIPEIVFPFDLEGESFLYDHDPILIYNGLPASLCDSQLNGQIVVNGTTFTAQENYKLNNDNFVGVISSGSTETLDISAYNIRHNNGQSVSSTLYDDSCSVTTSISFDNKNKQNEYDLSYGTGVLFDGFLATNEGNMEIVATSSGNAKLDDKDTWVIFASPNGEKTFVVELLGHREGDFRDVLRMELRGNDLFIGLRASYELNENYIDGSTAYLNFTITKFDSEADNSQMKKDVVNCLNAADPWAQKTFNVGKDITPVKAAKIVAHSQCFSNSISQQKWQEEDIGFWSMNTNHGVAANVVIPSGYLDANATYTLYIKKYDEDNFKGPRTIIYTDNKGRAITALPTLVEGDKILLKPVEYSAVPELVVSCTKATL